MPTERKIALVAELKELIEGAGVAIGVSFQGMPATEQARLRRALAADGAALRVVKNSLLARAAAGAGREAFARLADGPTALVTHPDDPVAAARAVHRYRRDRPQAPLEVRSAAIGDLLVDAAYVADLATVPPREELLGRIAGGLTGKIVELLGLLEASMREFSGLLDARAQQLNDAGAEA